MMVYAISKSVALPMKMKACQITRLTMRDLSTRNRELGAGCPFLLRTHVQVDLLVDWLPLARGSFLW